MILDDNVEVIVDDHLVLLGNDKPQLVAILILQFISLEVLENRGSREIVRYPVGGIRQITSDSQTLMLVVSA